MGAKCLTRFVLLFFVLLATALSRAADNRVYLVSQYDFGAKTGFYLNFENSTTGEQPIRLATLHLIFAVGDGNAWRFLNTTPALEYDYDYTVVGKFADRQARLLLDGKVLGEGEGGLKPHSSPLALNDSPGWAQAPAEYIIVTKSVTIAQENAKRLSVTLSQAGPSPVRLFGGRDTRRNETFRLLPGKMLTVTATFRLERRPERLQALSPFVDRYGQSVHAEWPGKVKTDADLQSAVAEETVRLKRLPASATIDAYGGETNAGWRDAATGYYRTVRHDRRWWLVSPSGNPLFYTGIDTAPALAWDTTPITGREFLFAELPPKDGGLAAAWSGNPWGETPPSPGVALHSVNMYRKYGADWQNREKSLTAQRARAWGFTGLGKWCDKLPGMPWFPVLGLGEVPKVGRHADVFDPAVKSLLEQALRKQMESGRDDPFIVGWSIGNEYDEIITPDEIRQMLAKPASTPAKRALVDYAIDTVYRGDAGRLATAIGSAESTREALYAIDVRLSDTEIEALRRYFADVYYDTLYKTVKRIDGNHLYFGFWISYGWWVNEEDWRLIGRHCDVIGYDRYAYSFADAGFDRLLKEGDKPVLCGEFSFPPGYRGERGYGFYPSSVEDDADAARYYTRWIADAARSPYCVGVCWFQYRDEPLTGRGPGQAMALVQGEDYAFGLVDVTDRPKWQLVTPVRKANLAATRLRNRP